MRMTNNPVIGPLSGEDVLVFRRICRRLPGWPIFSLQKSSESKDSVKIDLLRGILKYIVRLVADVAELADALDSKF